MQDVNQSANDRVRCIKTSTHYTSTHELRLRRFLSRPFTSDSKALGAKFIAQATGKTTRSSDKIQNSRSKSALINSLSMEI